MAQHFLKNFIRYNTLGPGFNPTPDFTITGPASIDEGAEADFSVKAFGLQTGSTIQWGIPDTANLSAGRFDNISGDVSILNNYNGSFAVTVSADNTTATNPQSYLVGLYWDGQVVDNSVIEVGVNDTSQTPPFGDQVVINLDAATVPVGVPINTNGIFNTAVNGGSPDGFYYISLNGNYAPYQTLVTNMIATGLTNWTVTGNNLTNEPVLDILSNFYGYGATFYGIKVANVPGDATIEFTFTPPATTWNDTSTFNQNATLVNGAAVSTSYGNIVTLDGTNDYVAIPMNYVDWLNQDITISIWFKTTDKGVILGQEGGSTPNAGTGGYVPAIYIGTDDKLYVSTFWHNQSNLVGVNVRLNDGQWHMLSVTTKTSGDTRFYIDGAVTGEYQISYGAQANYTLNYYYFLGTGKRNNWTNAGGSTYMNMSIGSFKTWYGIAPMAWVQNLYNTTKARFLTGAQTMIANSAYDGTSNGTISISIAQYPAVSRIPVGANISSPVLNGPATVSQSYSTGTHWLIAYSDQNASRTLLTTDVFTFTWTA